jgi:hypothetical protein
MNLMLKSMVLGLSSSDNEEKNLIRSLFLISNNSENCTKNNTQKRLELYPSVFNGFSILSFTKLPY